MNRSHIWILLYLSFSILFPPLLAKITAQRISKERLLLTVQSSSIHQMNVELALKKFYIDLLDFKLDGLVINEAIDLRSQNFSSMFMITFWLTKGFVIANHSQPIFILPFMGHDAYIAVTFDYGYFKFYNKHLQPLDSSCDSYLASYFDLDIEDLQNGRVNRTLLVSQIDTSFFPPMSRLDFSSNFIPTTKVCPLIFKNAFIGFLNIFDNRFV